MAYFELRVDRDEIARNFNTYMLEKYLAMYCDWCGEDWTRHITDCRDKVFPVPAWRYYS